MKVRVFMDTKAGVIEGQINGFLDYPGSGSVIKAETVVTTILARACNQPTTEKIRLVR